MEWLSNLFPGIGTLFAVEPTVAIARVVLIALGFVLAYMGFQRKLEPLIMVPMGIGMICVNAGVLFLEGGKIGTLLIDSAGQRNGAADADLAGRLSAAGLQLYVFQRLDRVPCLYGYRRAQ